MPGRPSLELPSEIVETLHSLKCDTRRMNGYIFLLREAGWTMSSVARAVNVSRQRIDQRLKEQPRSLTNLPGVPTPPKKEPPPRKVKKQLLLKPELIEELRRQMAYCSTVNGATPADDPRREVSVAFSATLNKLLEQGVSMSYLAQQLGIDRSGLYGRLARHGYRKAPPSQSQEKYKGRPVGSR